MEVKKEDLMSIKKQLAELLNKASTTSTSSSVIELNSADSLTALQTLDNIVGVGGYAKSQLHIVKDGSVVPVSLDTTDPYTMAAIPVTLVDIAGTTPVAVNLAGDLEVYIKHIADPITGEFSSIRLGDGTNVAEVTSNKELKVIDSKIDLTQYKFLDEAVNGTIATTKYYGFATTSGNYYIMKEDLLAKTIRYYYNKNSVVLYSASWNSRESLTFDYIFNLIWE